MRGILFDTHSLLWWDNAFAMSARAELAIQKAQAEGALFVSPISAWEIGAADRKKSTRPPLRGLAPEVWLQLAIESSHATFAPFTREIALEAARVPSLYGHGDPGDCFLIATAHIHDLALITRDRHILEFAQSHPDYLSVIPC